MMCARVRAPFPKKSLPAERARYRGALTWQPRCATITLSTTSSSLDTLRWRYRFPRTCNCQQVVYQYRAKQPYACGARPMNGEGGGRREVSVESTERGLTSRMGCGREEGEGGGTGARGTVQDITTHPDEAELARRIQRARTTLRECHRARFARRTNRSYERSAASPGSAATSLGVGRLRRTTHERQSVGGS